MDMSERVGAPTSPEPTDDYARAVDAYVRGTLITHLAPLVDWLANGSTGINGSIVTRPTTRKVLAFDASANTFGTLASAVCIFMAGNVLVGLARLSAQNRGGLEQITMATTLAIIAAAVGAVGVVTRVRHLALIFARCVTVVGRVTSTVETTRWGQPTTVLTVEYPYAGATRFAHLSFIKGKHNFVRPRPELLVDADRTSQIFLRDFYV